MSIHSALRVALLCGMVAFGWALLAGAPSQVAGSSPPRPDDPDALLAWLAEGHGDTDAAAWRSAGEILHWRQEQVAARQAWRRASRLARSAEPSPWSLYTLAWAAARLHDPEAPEHVERALESSRQREQERGATPRGPISRALLLDLLGEEERAAEELQLARFRLAAEGGASSSESLYWLAQIEALAGRSEMALAALQRAAEAGGRVRRIGRARWAPEFGELRDDGRFQRAIDRLERPSGSTGAGDRGVIVG